MFSLLKYFLNTWKIEAKNKKSFKAFMSGLIGEKTVLIIEPNNCHAEVIPSCVKYWHDLGYKTDIIITDKQMNPFEEIPPGTGLFSFNLKRIKQALISKKLFRYEYLFFTSSKVFYKFKEKNCAMVWDYFKIAQPKKDIIYTIHDRSELPADDKKSLVLTEAVKNKPYFCPCYFYKNTAPKKKNSVVNFITVGTLEVNRKDVNLLFAGINALKNKNFKITIIGEEAIKNQELMQLDTISKIDFLGKVDFKTLYKELENSDFYLPLLNPKLHKRYLNDASSGSFQLIKGFSKIPVIHESFCGINGFDEKNSVIYTDNFAQALQKCIDMSEKEFLAKQLALTKLRKTTMETSLNNLKRLINN